MKKDVHIGKLIKLKLSESNLSIADFAEAIHKTRTTVYDIFNRKSIDIDLLVTISEVLQFDFISYAYSNRSETSSPGTSNSYLIVKVVKECELEKEGPILFRYKLKTLQFIDATCQFFRQIFKSPYHLLVYICIHY